MALLACSFRQLRDEMHSSALALMAAGGGSGGGRGNAPALAGKRPVGRESTKELMEALQRLPISFGMANRLRPQCKEVTSWACHGVPLRRRGHCLAQRAFGAEAVALGLD